MLTISKVPKRIVNNDCNFKELFNSNNHWDDTRPDDYRDVLNSTLTKHWIDLFNQQYSVINIEDCDLSWMKRAAKIGSYTGLFPTSFQEELEDSLTRYKSTDKLFDNNTEYFVRSENVSLKYGVWGVGPYTSLKCIFESLVTSTSKHSPIHSDTTSLKIYLLPWKIINSSREFRVFVHKNKITAISQQNLYQTNKELKDIEVSGEVSGEVSDDMNSEVNYKRKSDPNEKTNNSHLEVKTNDERHIQNIESKNITNKVSQWVGIICYYFENVIKKKITYTDCYSIDFALLNDESDLESDSKNDSTSTHSNNKLTPYFIEINPFGKEYSSGSALFHWILDEYILYGKLLDVEGIHFRYTSE